MMFDAIATLATTIISRVWPDKTEQQKQEFALEFQKVLAESELAKSQIAVNTEEAKNPNLFVSGWRPFVGWVCASAFAWLFIVQPVCDYLVALAGHPPLNYPKLDSGQMMTILMGLLGLGTLRTYEKTRK